MTTANLPIAQRVAHLLYPTASPITRFTALVLIGAVLLAISAKIQLARRGWDKLILQFGMLNFLLGDAVKIIFDAVALLPIVKVIRRDDSDV